MSTPDEPAGTAATQRISGEPATMELSPEGEPAPAPSGKLPVAGWDRYVILEQIGEGGMGRVFKGHDPRLQRRVALKFLHRAGTHADRFQRESRLQARIEHPNICKVYEVGEVEGQPYIAMQLIEGGTLSELGDKATLEQKVRIMEAVAQAVHAAHRLELIHRDLKPSNVMVEKVEGGWKPYVMDFGLARELTASGLTVTGEVLGTPQFMAPEQARGKGAYDVRTDVYGLGATLFHLLTGQAPFEGSPAEVMSNVLHGEPVSVRKLVPDLPADLETIVARCLEKEPVRRYASAEEVAADLRRYLEGEPIHARRTSVAYRLRKKARKHRLVVIIGAVAALVVVLALLLVWRARRAADERARLAQRFAAEAEAIRGDVRRSFTLPLHDVRPEKREVAARIAALGDEIERRGDDAAGPGRYAVGRGLMGLGQVGEARRQLEAAWQAGYRTPEVAYALGVTLGELYRARAAEVDRVTDRAQREADRRDLERTLRDPALAYLRQGGGASEVPAYAEALIALYEGRSDAALAGARAALARAPWLYEARQLEGDAHAAVLRARFNGGDYDGAAAAAELALAAYRDAADIARSDARTHDGLCAVHGWRLLLEARRGQPPDEPLREAEAACDRALLCDADLPAPYRDRLRAMAAWASWAAKAGRDPTAVLDEAEALGARLVTVDDGAADTQLMLGEVARARGAYVWQKSGDPRPALATAIERYRRAVAINPRSYGAHADQAQAYGMLASYQGSHGIDPRPATESGLLEFQRAQQVDPGDVRAYAASATLMAQRAYYELEHGIDPRPSAARALVGYELAMTRDRDAKLYANAGKVRIIRAMAALARGDDPTPDLDAAEGLIRLALEVNPRFAEAHGELGRIAIRRAEHIILGAGGDATEALARARVELVQAMELDANNGTYAHQLARVALLAGRDAVAHGASPSSAYAAAERALAGHDHPPADREHVFLEMELHRRRAEAQAARGGSVAGEVAAGLAAAARIDHEEPAIVAVRGELVLLQAKATGDREAAARAAADLERALGESGLLLGREFRPLLEEARALSVAR